MYISVKSIRQGKEDGDKQVNVSSACLCPMISYVYFCLGNFIMGVVYGMLRVGCWRIPNRM